VQWDWWPSYARRDWKQLLPWVHHTEPRTSAPEATGILRAWEALALAHLGRHDEATVMAREALRLGGDDAAAWEALAVVAEQEDRVLHAIQHRIQIASRPPGSGHPWLQARARGLVLLELEAWEAAEAWLMACERQQPGNLEILLGLSRLPTATRAAAVGEALERGPRGRVTQLEFYRWHEVSSGMVDRMVASMGEPDADEPAAMAVGRGRSALVQSRPDEAEGWFRSAIDHPEATSVDRARARAGLIGLATGPARFEELLGVPPSAVELSASNAAAMVGYYTAQGDCDSAVRTGQTGLALGLAPFAFEDAALSCLSVEVGWSLVEQALGYGPVLDRAAMVLGRAPGSLATFVHPPPVPFWDEFRERDFAAVATLTTGAWRGLALAQMDRYAEATAALDAAEDASDDAAVIAFGRMLLAKQRGDVTGAMIQGAISATSEGGDPWIRTVARGITLADALYWRQAQVELLSALAAAPGYLEALEALSMVPQPLRYPAAEVALRYTPSGRVDADRWSAWYLLQGREEEALRALQWPAGFLAPGEEAAARRAIALGDVRGVQGDKDAARAAYGEAMSLAEGLDDRHLYCRAAARRVRAMGEEVSEEELVLMTGPCAERPYANPPEGEHPDAADAKGRIAALRSDCTTVADLAAAALVAGADPSDISEWMGDCADEGSVITFLEGETGGAPPEARQWLLHRVQPGDGDELPAPGEERSQDMLVRQLVAMQALAAHQGADFVALTYPFPGAHHQRLRDRLIAEAPRAGLTVLDLYGHFAETYSDAEWQALRTPENHVEAEGYETMGIELFEHVRRGGRLPR
jgi:tetratricopeptide (TPR) repeat protein